MPGALGKSEKPGWLEYPEPPERYAKINQLEVKMHFIQIYYDSKAEYSIIKSLLKHFHKHVNASVVLMRPLQSDATSTLAGIIRRAAAATLWQRLVG